MNLPLVYISTLPKSGSVYTLNMIAEGLGIRKLDSRTSSNSAFPKAAMMWPALKSQVEDGEAIYLGHIDASVTNLQVMEDWLERVVVLIRDPRSATLSMAHHLNRYHKEGLDEAFASIHPKLPEDYFDITLVEQIDWLVQFYFPGCIYWIQTWLRYADEKNGGMEVLLKNYDELRLEPKQFFESIISFYNITKDHFNFRDVRKDSTTHFRKGAPTEWEAVFTSSQLRRCRQLIPASWYERFGWSDSCPATLS